MMLRLVLVGIVAGLGVTIPSCPEGPGWFLSAERWANSVLAAWDDWTPEDADAQLDGAVTKVHQCEQCRLARSAIALRERSKIDAEAPRVAKSPSGGTAAVARKWAVASAATPRPDSQEAPTARFEPIEVGNEFYAGVAYELNRNAEGLDLAQPPATVVAVAAARNESGTDETFALDVPEFLCGALEDDLMDQPSIALTAEPVMARTPTACDTFNEIESDDALDAELVAGDDSPAFTEPDAVAMSQNHTQSTDLPGDLPWPAFAPVEKTGERMSQVALGPTVPWPVFAPVERTATSNIAASTAPAVEGQAAALAAPASSSMQAVHLGQAAELTRQALGAWLRVLVETTPVKVTAR